MAQDCEKVNEISPRDPQRGVGDNGGPKLKKLTAIRKVERIKEVLDMDISSAQKCIGISIICDADTDGVTPELSTEDLKRRASVKDRETVYRATRKLDEVRVAKTVKTHGRPNRYLVLSDDDIDAVIDEIEETTPAKPDTPVRPNPTGATTDTSQVQPDYPVRPDPTGPDGLAPQDARPHAPARAGDNTSRANKESPSEIDSNSSLSEGDKESLPAVRVNCTAIHGPNFTIDLGAVDIASGMAGIPIERGRQIAEICARDWAANGTKPQHPMAMVRRAITMDRNHMQTDDARAAAPAKDSVSARRERIRKAAEEAEAKYRAEQQQWSRSQ